MDVAVAAAVAAGTSLVDAFGSLPGGAVGWDLLLAAPLVLRRRWPAWAAALIAAVCLAQWLAGVRATGDVAFLVALYSLGAYDAGGGLLRVRSGDRRSGRHHGRYALRRRRLTACCRACCPPGP